MTTPDNLIRQRTAEYFVELVNFCADLGGKFIIVGSPKQRSLSAGEDPQRACEHATGVLRESIRRAEDNGIIICFEPLAPSETNFINTHTQAIELTRSVASPAFKIILDVKAMCSMGKPIPQIIQESRGEFSYFHANDLNLKGPGFGDIDFAPISEALRAADYNGYVSVEVFKFDEGAEAIATRSREYLREKFGE